MPFPKYFDAHTHLKNYPGRREAGAELMLLNGTAPDDWQKVLDLASADKRILPCFGLHPWFAGERSDAWLEKLEKLLREVPAAAVGEIGLDHMIDERNDEDQAMVFIAQLKLARKLKRAVSMHSRKAWGTMMDILEKQCGTPDGGVIHSYSGPPDRIRQLETLNVSFSFSGSITYERNKRGRASLTAVAERYLLVETDSPDIPPLGVEQGMNEPAFLKRVVETAALLRGCSVEEISEITCRNGTRVFCQGNAVTV